MAYRTPNCTKGFESKCVTRDKEGRLAVGDQRRVAKWASPVRLPAGVRAGRWLSHKMKTPSLRFRFFDEGFLADDDDAGRSHMKAAAVGFEVVADFGVLGKIDVAVDDGALDA